MTNIDLINLLHCRHRLEESQWQQLFTAPNDGDLEYAMSLARDIAVKNFGKTLYFRGIVEFSNICKCDCL